MSEGYSYGAIAYEDRLKAAEAELAEWKGQTHAYGQRCEQLYTRVEAAEAERDEALKLLGEAVESIEHWAGYASEYFHDKWGLEGDLAKFRLSPQGEDA